MYSVQQCQNNPLVITIPDIQRFIGIAIFMSLIKLATGRRLKDFKRLNGFRVSQIADVMTVSNETKQ